MDVGYKHLFCLCSEHKIPFTTLHYTSQSLSQKQARFYFEDRVSVLANLLQLWCHGVQPSAARFLVIPRDDTLFDALLSGLRRLAVVTYK